MVTTKGRPPATVWVPVESPYWEHPDRAAAARTDYVLLPYRGDGSPPGCTFCGQPLEWDDSSPNDNLDPPAPGNWRDPSGGAVCGESNLRGDMHVPMVIMSFTEDPQDS